MHVSRDASSFWFWGCTGSLVSNSLARPTNVLLSIQQPLVYSACYSPLQQLTLANAATTHMHAWALPSVGVQRKLTSNLYYCIIIGQLVHISFIPLWLKLLVVPDAISCMWYLMPFPLFVYSWPSCQWQSQLNAHLTTLQQTAWQLAFGTVIHAALWIRLHI